MQAEVKVILHTAADYGTIRNNSNVWQLIGEDNQEDHFFDGASNELSKTGAVLRIRFVSGGRCSVALKEHTRYEAGSSMRWKKEAPLDPSLGRAMLKDPSTFFGAPTNEISELVYQHFGVRSLVYIGGFNTKRATFNWVSAASQQGLKLSLDCTTYPFGERYELEVTNILIPVQDVLEELEGVLNQLRVTYALGQETKLEYLIKGQQAPSQDANMVNEVKVTLPDEASLNTVACSLEDNFIGEKYQENYFFDSPENTLLSQQAYFRIRVSGNKCTAVVKEHVGVAEGSSLYWGKEIEIPHNLFDDMRRSPSAFLDWSSPVANGLKNKFGMTSLRLIGSFTNVRRLYWWKAAKSQPGIQVQLDVTTYPFGKRYELEVPNVVVPIHDVLDEVQAALEDLGVSSEPGSSSKFSLFLSNNQPISA